MAGQVRAVGRAGGDVWQPDEFVGWVTTQPTNYQNYHRVLNRARWSSVAVARGLLEVLVRTFVPEGPVVIGLDDMLERRRGEKIRAKGIYRDPVRSSRAQVVTASGLRWLCAMLLVEVKWAGRIWALPFLTALCPSERYHQQRGQRHKTLPEGVRRPTLQHVPKDPQTCWRTVTVQNWYGGGTREVEVCTDAAVWYHTGLPPVRLRWVLIRDPQGECAPQALLSTQLAPPPTTEVGVVREALDHGSDLGRSPCPSGPGDPTAVE